MIHNLIYLIVIGFILGILYWLIDYLQAPDPINRILKAVIILVGVLFLINFLLVLAGQPAIIKFQ